ncbi:MAG: hypothetical protein KDD77_18995, partial [Caldilineaceae bacterium]|nr:hypothetical protein [Caldilineaceae bacterium]
LAADQAGPSMVGYEIHSFPFSLFKHAEKVGYWNLRQRFKVGSSEDLHQYDRNPQCQSFAIP